MGSINNVELFRQRMLDGKICVGTSVQLTDLFVSEVAAEAGNDFIWIEYEHTYLDLKGVLGHIMAVRGTPTVAIVRVAWNDPVLLKPVLDMAPAGVVVPMIRTADDALRAVQACRYPPEGIRGFGPMRNMYGIDSMEQYLKTAPEQIMVFVQVEHIDAVHNLDEILQTPGLDGIVLGRNDLSGSMGKLGQTQDSELLEIIDTVFAKTRAAGKFLGVSIGYNLDTVREWFKKGVQWFALGEDIGHIFDGSKAVVDAVRKLDK